MALTATASTSEPRSFSIGPLKAQLLDYTANSGDTSGTVTANRLSSIKHILVLGGQLKHSSAPTFSGNVATLAIVVPAETAASRTIDGILYTATANQGASGNSITIELVDGTGDEVPVTAGNEVVEVAGTAITVRIDPTAVIGSTRDDVKAAVIASAAASALVTPSTVTSGSTVASVTAATPLQNGVTGGSRGTLLCLGN